MKLSMKSRYGLRALIDLAINSKTEQVFASLRKAGIVKSIKAPRAAIS